jgi:hypothetical protein
MPSSVKEILAEANAAVPRLSIAEARTQMGAANVLIPFAIRASGKLKGSHQRSRGSISRR